MGKGKSVFKLNLAWLSKSWMIQYHNNCTGVTPFVMNPHILLHWIKQKMKIPGQQWRFFICRGHGFIQERSITNSLQKHLTLSTFSPFPGYHQPLTLLHLILLSDSEPLNLCNTINIYEKHKKGIYDIEIRNWTTDIYFLCATYKSCQTLVDWCFKFSLRQHDRISSAFTLV